MKLFLTLTSVMIMNVCIACDFCGCYMGITPYDNQSSVSLLYRYKSYNGYKSMRQEHHLFPAKSMTTNSSLNNAQQGTMKHLTNAAAPEYAQKDFEIYTSAELRAKYYIHNRFELNAIIPFVMNSCNLSDEEQNVKSFGDITFTGAYRLIDRTLTEKFQQRLILGAGIKLPTGQYKSLSDDGDRIDPMLQSGTGSTDYLFYLNYIFSYRKVGVNLNTVYKLNGTNSLHERIGNSSTNYINLFVKLREEKDLKIFPSLQGFYEYTNGFYVDNKYQNGTTISCAMAGAGIDIYYKNISLNTSFQLPVYEEVLASDPSGAGRFMVGLTYSFNQNKYLIKSKKSTN